MIEQVAKIKLIIEQVAKLINEQVAKINDWRLSKTNELDNAFGYINTFIIN